MKMISTALMALGLLLLSGCTPQPASFTVDDFYGTWTYSGNLFQFNEDGTFVVAVSVDELTSRPLQFGEFRFEGTTLTFIQDEESLRCAGGTRIYEVEMAEDGSRFKSILVDDPCPGIHAPSVIFERYSP